MELTTECMVIYKITNKINNKVYIGQTSSSIKRRWAQHCYINKTAISSAIRKYGKENFTIEEIDGANSLSELNYLEQHYIYVYNSMAPNGYNLTSGGMNRRLSEETINKISKSQTGKKWSDESKRKLSETKTGYKFSEECKAKMSQDRKGKKKPSYTEERKLKMSESCKGRVFTEEHRRKLAEAKRGKPSNHRIKIIC